MTNESNDYRDVAFGQLSERLGVPIDSVYLVADAIDSAPTYAGEEPGDAFGQTRHCSAREVCIAVRQMSVDLWADEWDRALHDLGLRTASDIGRIVYALIGAGWIEESPDDCAEDFEAQDLFGAV